MITTILLMAVSAAFGAGIALMIRDESLRMEVDNLKIDLDEIKFKKLRLSEDKKVLQDRLRMHELLDQ